MQATKSTHTLNMRAVLITTLTDDERSALYARYMAGEGATKLIAELGLDIAASQFMRIFPPEEIGGCCALCGGGLLRAKQSRHGQRQAAYCGACGHSGELGKRCGCASCSAALLKAYEEHRAAKAATEAEKRSLARKLYWSAEADAQSEPMTQWHTHAAPYRSSWKGGCKIRGKLARRIVPQLSGERDRRPHCCAFAGLAGELLQQRRHCRP